MAKKILTIQAKCSDLCFLGYTDQKSKEFSHTGYVPMGMGIGGGDYIEIEIDIETGQVLNRKDLTEENILKHLE